MSVEKCKESLSIVNASGILDVAAKLGITNPEQLVEMLLRAEEGEKQSGVAEKAAHELSELKHSLGLTLMALENVLAHLENEVTVAGLKELAQPKHNTAPKVRSPRKHKKIRPTKVKVRRRQFEKNKPVVAAGAKQPEPEVVSAPASDTAHSGGSEHTIEVHPLLFIGQIVANLKSEAKPKTEPKKLDVLNGPISVENVTLTRLENGKQQLTFNVPQQFREKDVNAGYTWVSVRVDNLEKPVGEKGINYESFRLSFDATAPQEVSLTLDQSVSQDLKLIIEARNHPTGTLFKGTVNVPELMKTAV